MWSLIAGLQLYGEAPAHDPSTMLKDGDRYWIFTTGNGIVPLSASNPNFTDWRIERGPFAGGYPNWINNYVSGFTGTFWAPDVIYRNGEYRLYYACSTFGSKISCIGLATASTLSGPWTDRGVVTYSNASTSENAIDPAIFQDWLIYGSFFGGIRMAQLGADGKLLNATRYAVASGDVEASYLLQNGSYYYLFINRGACCKGVDSTYHIQVGRSTNIVGPYLDKSGKDLNAGGGTDFMVSNGRYIGPGHFGYGEGKLTYHFYDRDDNGTAKLGITTLGWGSDGWPIAGGTSTPTPTPTVVPTPTPLQNPIWSGGPYTLNGTSDYIDLPDGVTVNLYDFSVATWVNLDQNVTWTRVFDFGMDTNYNMFFTTSSESGYPRFAITISGNGNEQMINGTSIFPTGSWQHVVVVKSGNTGILYINNQEAGRNSNLTLRPLDLGKTVNNYLGRSQYSSDPYLDGQISTFAFYNRTISTAEISALFNDKPGATALGDVNKDGKVTIVDAMLVAQFAAGLGPAGFERTVADVNCSGTTDINDALLLARFAAGLITKLGC